VTGSNPVWPASCNLFKDLTCEANVNVRGATRTVNVFVNAVDVKMIQVVIIDLIVGHVNNG
jgi:hypothetical protein